MVRRVTAVLAGLLLVSIMFIGTAGAQQSPGPTVLPDTPTTQPAQVRGDVVTRPLPRTGSDLGGAAIFGAALTITGVALAVGARQRRHNFETA